MCSSRRLLIALLFAATAGCGKQGDPLPPVRAVPQAARDLAIQQRGAELVFEFGYPATTAAGTALGELEAVELLALTRPPAAPGSLASTGPVAPREFAAAAQEALRISGSELTSAIDGDRIRLRLPAPAAGTETTYAVRSLAKGGAASGFSNLVTLTAGTPPPAPTGLAVAGAQEGVRLSWQAPDSGGVHVYRRDATRRAFGKPLASLPPGAGEYLDSTAQFGERYVYAVTALAPPAPPPPPAAATPEAPATPPAPVAPRASGPPIESATAGEQEIQHLDHFAPPPPSRVVALSDRGRVRVVWEASGARDTTGYVVFRRDLGSGPGAAEFRRLNPDPVVALELTDTEVRSGKRYAYRVAAIDAAGNLGEPSAAVDVEVESGP